MLSLFDSGFKKGNENRYLKRVHLFCSRIFSVIEKNEKNLALITGMLILISAFGGSIKSTVVLLREFGFIQFDAIYKFVESHLIIFEGAILLLKLITVFFALAFLGKYGLAKFVDSTKKLIRKIDEDYEKIRHSVYNNFLDNLHRLVNPNSWSNDLDILANLGYQAFGEENITKEQRREWFEELWRGNSEVFSLILERNTKKVIGYVCIIPLNEAIGSHNFKGNFSQFNICQEAICKNTPAKYVCWQAVYLEEEYQDNFDYVSVLTRLLFLKTKNFIKETETIIYAESFTNHGTKILLRFGFEGTNVMSYQKHEIFAIKLADSENLNSAAKHSLEMIKGVQP